MPKSKESKFVDKLLKNALKELDTLVPKEEPEVRKVLPSAGKTSVHKKKITKAVKDVSKKKEPKKTSKPKKAPLKVKRMDEDPVADMATKNNLIIVNPPPPVVEEIKQEDAPGKTKVVIKDGMVVVQLDE